MKILFADLDGTLLDNKSQVSAGTKAFLDGFLSAGNKLVLSSGRPLESILEVKENAGLTRPGILISANNGTLIYDPDAQAPIMEKRLPLPWVDVLQEKADEAGIHIQTYKDDAIIAEAEDEELTFYRRRIHVPVCLAAHFTDVMDKGPHKMLAIHLTDHQALVDFRESMSDWGKDKIQMIFSSEAYLEIFSIEGGKGNAVRYLCDYFGVDRADSYAAGDAENDISMLTAAGCGIAMQNAVDAAKEAADVVTESDNDNDGLAKCMEKLL